MIAVVALALALAPVAAPPDPLKTVNPDAAAEGPRDLSKLQPMFAAFVSRQPYGKEWRELVKVERAPRDQSGLGQAKTHPALKNDPAEMQQQVQFLEETATETRYGHASVRAVRVFRYGKLRAVRLIVAMAGRVEQAAFQQDARAIAEAWKEPLAALGLGSAFKITRNDFVTQQAKTPAEFPKAPLVIELEPAGS